jgi:hypothetical protein
MKNEKDAVKKRLKEERNGELIDILAEISVITGRLAERIALLEWRRSNTKEAEKS